MVEAIANSVEDRLVDGLSFKLAPGASYITDRRSVTFHPQGSNVYMPNSGTRLIRLLLTGDSWLDPSTFRVMFDLKNNGTGNQELRPLGGPWAFFRRMRVLCGGQVIEDIDNYNRTHEMMHTLIAPDSRVQDMAEAFGQQYRIHGNIAPLDVTNFKGIDVGDHQTCMFKPLSGLLNQPKYLPIRYCPLTLELELVDSFTTPIISTFGAGADDFKADNTSTAWQIQNVQVKCDLCTLDNALDNSYAEHLLGGKSLPINYNTFVTQSQSISGQANPKLNVTRALTRLKSIFVSLEKDGGTPAVGLKPYNDFFSPASLDIGGGVLKHKSDGEFEFRIQVGSKIYPEYPIRSHAEAFYQLKKTLGVHSSTLHNFDITGLEYRDHKFILGIDTEKVLEAGYTGLNTRSGDLLNIDFKYNSAVADRLADRLHIVLHSDQIMEIRDTGVQVFD
jgi:hypothetical protein